MSSNLRPGSTNLTVYFTDDPKLGTSVVDGRTDAVEAATATAESRLNVRPMAIAVPGIGASTPGIGSKFPEIADGQVGLRVLFGSTGNVECVLSPEASEWMGDEPGVTYIDATVPLAAVEALFAEPAGHTTAT